jgi:hypothetical protein
VLPDHPGRRLERLRRRLLGGEARGERAHVQVALERGEQPGHEAGGAGDLLLEAGDVHHVDAGADDHGPQPNDRRPAAREDPGRRAGAAAGADYSTVTDFARLRGWSTS